jgi:Ca2+-binding EF-hand superfamily protein
MLSIYDRNHSGFISFDNFLTIFQAYYINFPISDIKSIFSLFDATSNSLNNNNKNEYKDISMFKIKYDNLLKSIIGKMSIKRQLLVKKVFDSFEKDNEGKIMTSDIKSKFNYKKHPDALSGKNTPNEIYSDFLDFLETFREYNDNLKGGYSFNMSFEEFLDFYSEISMSIEDDDLFEYLLINCWDLKEENNDENENNNLNKNIDSQNKEEGDNNNIMNFNNESNNFNNISNNYLRNSHHNNQNNDVDDQNIRMKIGSQIVNNRKF